MSVVRYLSPDERMSDPSCTSAMAEAVLGSEADAEFMEEFVPLALRVPPPKPENFIGFLNDCSHVWEVRDTEACDEPVGFILICSMPCPNSIGFGIQQRHAHRGIMTHALAEVIASGLCSLPLNASTSKRNRAAIRLLERVGFAMAEEYDEHGEASVRFVFSR